jgi:ADP-ribose pyrophosphatase
MSEREPSSSPKILSRQETRLSRWVTLVQKEVESAPGGGRETYHCFAQADYVVILARTPAGLIPIVRQYRPAVEAYTWELPAGLLEPGEDPEDACRRELEEETGLEAQSVTCLGIYYADTGRLENRQHVFCAQTSEPKPDFAPEPGMSVAYVSVERLRDLIRAGQFRHQLHIAVLLLDELKIADQGRTAGPS